MKLADTPEANAQRFLQVADAAGISKMVVHDVGADHLSDPAPADLTRINDLLLRVCAVSPPTAIFAFAKAGIAHRQKT